jgi:hypothetical protein
MRCSAPDEPCDLRDLVEGEPGCLIRRFCVDTIGTIQGRLSRHAGAIGYFIAGLLAALTGAPTDTSNGLLLAQPQVDDIEPADEALDFWLEGDIENAARLMRRARRDAAKQNDADEVGELDLLITKMRSNLNSDNLAYFDAVLAGRRVEQVRAGRGQGLRGGDYVVCLIIVPLAAIPAAILLAVTGNDGSIGRYLLLVTLTLSAGTGVWAGWREEWTNGVAVAIGAFMLSWLALFAALFLAAGLGGGG